MLAALVCEPEFEPQHTLKSRAWQYTFASLALERKRQENPWRSLGSQPSWVSKFKVHWETLADSKTLLLGHILVPRHKESNLNCPENFLSADQLSWCQKVLCSLLGVGEPSISHPELDSTYHNTNLLGKICHWGNNDITIIGVTNHFLFEYEACSTGWNVCLELRTSLWLDGHSSKGGGTYCCCSVKCSFHWAIF